MRYLRNRPKIFIRRKRDEIAREDECTVLRYELTFFWYVNGGEISGNLLLFNLNLCGSPSSLGSPRLTPREWSLWVSPEEAPNTNATCSIVLAHLALNSRASALILQLRRTGNLSVVQSPAIDVSPCPVPPPIAAGL